MERTGFANFLEMVDHCKGSFDEWPLLVNEADPMPYFSRNETALPFYVVSETDEVLIVLEGQEVVSLRDTPAQDVVMEGGETLYLPAGIPYTIQPVQPTFQLVLRAQPLGRRALLRLCAQCGKWADQYVADASIFGLHQVYIEGLALFNSRAPSRACPGCGQPLALLPTSPFRWAEVRKELEADESST